MKDEKIIEMFFARSERAISELTAKYGALLMRVAMNIVGNRADAEECCNDTYLCVWDTIPPKRPNSLSAYSCGIARNIARKKCAYNTTKLRNSEYDKSLDELYDAISAPNWTEEQISASELAAAINAFLKRERPVDRELFVRRYYLCESVAAAAMSMTISVNKASVRLSRQRDRLSKFLREEGYII